jgi:lipopolysaccharide export system permease protein
VGAALSGVLFFLNEQLVPHSSEQAEQIKSGTASKSAKDHWLGRVDIRNASDQRIWNMAGFNTETDEMIEPHVEWFLKDGTRKQLIAKRGGRTNDNWVFYDVEFFSYEPNLSMDKIDARPIRTNIMVLPELTETPREIKLQLRFQRMNAIEAAKRTQLSLSEIRYLRKHLELNKRDQALLETQYQARLAQPWTCLVVVLVALPFGASTTSRRNVFVGVASSIFIVFIYFIVLRLGLALGTGAYIPPAVAAWTPNILFGGSGILMAWKLSR